MTTTPQDQRRLGTLLQLGATYNLLGKYAKAEPLRRSAVQGLESLVGSDDAMLPGALAPWAVSLMHLSRPKEAVDLLKRADRALSVRCWAADGLAAVGPAAAPAVPGLISVLKTHPRREPSLEGPERYYADARMSAATALGAIGPAARAAVPDLRQASEDEKEAVREAARAALRRIEAR